MAFIILIASVFLFIYSLKQKRKLDKYEFKNRASGGVVEFPTFEEAEKHKMKGGLYYLLFVISFIAGLGSLIAIMAQGK